MFNDLGPFEAFYKAINSLPTNMLTAIMSTELTKWSVKMFQNVILGGFIMIQALRDFLKRDIHPKTSRGNTKDHSEWV